MTGVEQAPGAVPGTELGAFVRARREALRPEDVGLPAGGDRRVLGLRREEVALLAGVSIEYLKRIEQGRERRPSSQVLDAIARALRLDQHASTYLFRVGQAYEPGATRAAGQVSPALRDLLEQFGPVPAYVVDPAMTIMAANAITESLYEGFHSRENLLRMIFLDPHAAEFYLDWDRTAEGAVRNFRAIIAERPDYYRIPETVGELIVRSPAFAALWARFDVRPRALEDKGFRHPRVGELHLRFHSFSVDDAPGQQLYVYSPRPGSSSADALRILASIGERQGNG
jgi:transcriptional regulator with XRE-family HTH domain